MTLTQQYNSLCPPARLYLVIKGMAILILFIQNLREPRAYKIGSYKVDLTHHNIIYFIIKVVVMFAWTWVLNNFCSKGYKGVAWFLVLIPFILFFVVIGLFVLSGQKLAVQKKRKRDRRRRHGRVEHPPKVAPPPQRRGPPPPPVRTNQVRPGHMQRPGTDWRPGEMQRYSWSRMPQGN